MKRLMIACGFGTAAVLSPSLASAQSVAVGDATVAPVTRDYGGANINELFAAVEESYKKAGIPITERDPIGFSVSNPSFAASKKVFNINLEKIFDCGGDKKSPAAANATLVLSVSTVLVRTDDGVRVRSLLTASGTVMSESGPTAAHCTSLGALEKRLQPDPTKLQCGGTGAKFVTTVITSERMPVPASPITMRGPGVTCLPTK